MAQKINSNIFHFSRKQKIQSSYIEKKVTDHSIFLKTDIEIKNFAQIFFKIQKITINNCKLVYLNNILYIYLSYYKELKENFLFSINTNHQKFLTIQNNFSCKKEVRKLKNNNIIKKIINKN
jgi:hypothetical protein